MTVHEKEQAVRLRDIQICRWKYGALAPACLMVDDLANVWIKTKNGPEPQPGDDWGHFKRRPYSSLWWLENRVLKGFDHTRVTFFVSIARAPETINHSCQCHFGSIDEDDATREFFLSIHDSPRYELAYHGYTHGVSGTESKPFVQEWRSFCSLEEAIEKTNRGREIFNAVTGVYPRGGKYCGYQSNEFSDESIEKCGFDWWCRYDTRSLIRNGGEKSELFKISSFGIKPVIDLPTTLYGHILTPVPPDTRGALWCFDVVNKYLVCPFMVRSQINYLVKNGLPILIQEHSARSRTNGLLQTPNIVDDTIGLRLILNYLSSFNLWHATCSEISDYHRLREMVAVRIVDSCDAFLLEGVQDNCDIEISIKLHTNGTPPESIYLETPNGKTQSQVAIDGNTMATFVPVNGLYKLVAE